MVTQFGGERGIRTLEAALRPPTRFPVVLLRPARTSLLETYMLWIPEDFVKWFREETAERARWPVGQSCWPFSRFYRWPFGLLAGWFIAFSVA